MSLIEVKQICAVLSDKISERVDKDSPDAITFRLEELVSLQASSTYCMALSQRVYNAKIAELVQQERFSKLSATDKKMVFAGEAQEEIYYMELADRFTRNISYGIDAMRSLLSFIKSEMTNAQHART